MSLKSCATSDHFTTVSETDAFFFIPNISFRMKAFFLFYCVLLLHDISFHKTYSFRSSLLVVLGSLGFGHYHVKLVPSCFCLMTPNHVKLVPYATLATQKQGTFSHSKQPQRPLHIHLCGMQCFDFKHFASP